MTTSVQIDVPNHLAPIYYDYYAFIVLYGGRAGAKSFCIAEYMLVKSFQFKDCYFLCAREVQSSLLASVFSVLDMKIKSLGLSAYFHVTREGIRNKSTGVKIIFKGLWLDPDSIKGIPDLKMIWVDEAARISKNSWHILPPTATRNEGCQIIVTFNPEFTTDVVYEEFIANNTRKNAFIREVSYKDNPFPLPQEFYDELEALKERDYEEYLHVYEGHCRTNSQAKIFKKGVYWTVKDFEEYQGAELMFGLDLGFSPEHPTFGVRLYIHEKQLWITHEAVATELDTDRLGGFLVNNLPHIKNHTVDVDSSRPETISYLNKQYLPQISGYLFARGVEKGQGSVEDGIEFMKSFAMINIHPRCVKLIENFEKYSYKTDKKGSLLREPEKKHDDGIDAIRYALEATMKDRFIDYSKWYGLN